MEASMSPESSAVLRGALEGIPLAIVVAAENGRIAMMNAQAEKLFGFARGEILGQPIEMLVPLRFRDAHPAHRAQFMAMPLARPMGAGRDLYGMRKDGSEFPVEIGLNPIVTDRGKMVISAVVDITERRRQEERFRQVVESAPNAMVMVNRAGRIVMVNAQTEKVFGYDRSELIDQRIEMLIPLELRGSHPSHREEFFAAPNARPMGAGRDLFARRKDGREFPVEIGLNPIQTEEGPMVLSAIVDITERKQREEGLRAALLEKDLLLGEIHHRVKNNLQIIHSLMDLQAIGSTDERVQNVLRDGQNRIQSMSLIHQTLYQSHDFARVDLKQFFDSLLPELLGSYGKSSELIRLRVAADGVHLPINVAIPCGLIVNELVSNALKHAFPDGRAGNLSVELAELPEQQMRLVVSNDGLPIPDDLDFDALPTLGYRLVTLLTAQLGGKLEVSRRAPTSFSVSFRL